MVYNSFSKKILLYTNRYLNEIIYSLLNIT